MSYAPISLPQLAVSLVFLLGAALVARALALRLSRALFVGALRAAAQLMAVGYFLATLFTHQSVWAVAAVLAVMWSVAAWTSARRVEGAPASSHLLGYAFVAVGCGALAALLPLFTLIVRPQPFFDARVVVPLAGMMLSSAMNVVAQVFERIFALARSESAVIEQVLALGGSPRQAMQPQARAAVKAALIPTLNGLATVGLVALPGMMTGQILSGVPPTEAVRYQLVIMYQLVAVAAVAGGCAAWFCGRLLFNAQEQLRG